MNSQMCPPKKLHPFFLPLFLLEDIIESLHSVAYVSMALEWKADEEIFACWHKKSFINVVSDLKSHMLEGGQDVTFWAVKRLFFRA